MPRKAKPLTAAKVRTAQLGRYGDGNGLYLLVREAGRWWLFRWVRDGKMREMGLGRAGERPGEVTLAEARARAGDLMRVVSAGMDPLVQRAAEAEAATAAAKKAAISRITFGDVLDQYVAAHEAGWRNAKHRQQWRGSMALHVVPKLGAVPVADVATDQVLSALRPIWTEKPETASRVRGRIESVLDFAAARGWRSDDNPARWRGRMQSLLPSVKRLARVHHHPALPWQAVPTFMEALADRDGVSPLALRFCILTAARSGEVLGARWQEIDLAAAVWTVPAARMKAAREHRVPLSEAALAVLSEVATLRTDDRPEAPVFPGMRGGRGLGAGALANVLFRLGRADLTVHGFRSSFRDWCADATDVDRDTAEAALAHTLRDKTEAAYRRGDLFEKRRRLMEAWAEFCAKPMPERGTVTTFRKAG